MAQHGGFAPTLGGKLATAIVLTCPMFFSGIVFSTLIAGIEGHLGRHGAEPAWSHVRRPARV